MIFSGNVEMSTCAGQLNSVYWIIPTQFAAEERFLSLLCTYPLCPDVVSPLSTVPSLQKGKASAITSKGQSEDFMRSINNRTKG
jgi:hypothetical protein